MEVTLSRKWAKSRTRGRKLHSTGAKARVARTRKTRADLEQQLKAYRREITHARERLVEAMKQQTATSEVLRIISKLAASVGAGRGGRKCRSPVRREQCGDLSPGGQPSSAGRFLRENS